MARSLPAESGIHSDSRGEGLEAKELNKIFVGGLSQEVAAEELSDYFSKFGPVIDAIIMEDHETSRSRGFGFVTFESANSVEACLQDRFHIIRDKRVECKKATPRATAGHLRNTFDGGDQLSRPFARNNVESDKIFVGGLPDLSTEEFRAYFENFGSVTDAVLMVDRGTNRPRGFGFITFKDSASVDRVMRKYHEHHLHGKWVECKVAQPREASRSAHAYGSNRPPMDYGWGGPNQTAADPNHPRSAMLCRECPPQQASVYSPPPHPSLYDPGATAESPYRTTNNIPYVPHHNIQAPPYSTGHPQPTGATSPAYFAYYPGVPSRVVGAPIASYSATHESLGPRAPPLQKSSFDPHSGSMMASGHHSESFATTAAPSPYNDYHQLPGHPPYHTPAVPSMSVPPAAPNSVNPMCYGPVGRNAGGNAIPPYAASMDDAKSLSRHNPTVRGPVGIATRVAPY